MGADALFPFVAPSESELGSCIGGISTVDFALSKVTGRTALAHRIMRRLNTPRGGLFYAPDYGYDLTALIGSTESLSLVEQRVEEQVLAEEEVSDARAAVSLSTGTLTVDIQAVSAEGPFTLVISASDLTVSALLDGVELFKEST